MRSPGSFDRPTDDRCAHDARGRCHTDQRSGGHPLNRLVMGSRRSRPNALIEIFGPGADWRRLYSARSTIRSYPLHESRVVAGREQCLAAEVAVDVVGQERVELVVVGQRVACRAGPGAAPRWAACVMEFSGIGGVSPRRSASALRHLASRHTMRLRHVLDRVEPADRVAVQSGVSDRQLALVAGGQHADGRPGWTVP